MKNRRTIKPFILFPTVVILALLAGCNGHLTGDDEIDNTGQDGGTIGADINADPRLSSTSEIVHFLERGVS